MVLGKQIITVTYLVDEFKTWVLPKHCDQLVMKDFSKGPLLKIAMIIYPMFEDFGNSQVINMVNEIHV